jgi:mRNA interferase RelE/StbE
VTDPEPVYTVKWTETAVELLDGIPDQRIQRNIHSRAGQLAHSPELQGKALIGELAGYRSVRAVGQKYRIVYRVKRQEVIVAIVAVGRRKHGDARDIYTLARKLLRQGLIEERTARRARR